MKYLVLMGLSTACPLLFNQVQSPANGASLVVLSALISGGAGAAAGAGAVAVCMSGVSELLEPPLAAAPTAVRSALASRSAVVAPLPSFSSASSFAMRAFISASSLMTASLVSGAVIEAGGFGGAVATGGAAAAAAGGSPGSSAASEASKVVAASAFGVEITRGGTVALLEAEAGLWA